MKRNKHTLRKGPLGKAIRAALPLFAMAGMASIRMGSASVTSGRRFIKPAVVVVDSADAGIITEDVKLIEELAKQAILEAGSDRSTQFVYSPFGAFSSIQGKATKQQNVTKAVLAGSDDRALEADLAVNRKTLAFLQANGLLSRGEITKANISGDTLQDASKRFAHTINSATSSFNEVCDGTPYTRFQYSTTGSAINNCTGVVSAGPNVQRTTAIACQVVHEACGNGVHGAPVLDSDGDLTASGTVTEPIALATTIDTVGEAVDVFDFTLIDGGGADGNALTATQVVVNVAGTSTDGERAQIVWRLDGPDVTDVTGVYDAGGDTITFSTLSISVADGTNEVYTVNAYYGTNTGISDNTTFTLSVDGDTDLTVGGAGTQMGATT
ncbi:MAG: hypothetical protein COA42_22355, partial [Alteromonadaceae bacterium]